MMRVVRSLAALAVVAGMLLSGCLGTTESPLSESPTPTADAGAGGNQTQAPADSTPEPNQSAPAQPPVLAANVTVDGQVIAINGTVYDVPSGTDVVFGASNSTDPEGGNLSFTWSLDNDTVEGPVATFQFEQGTANVTLAATSSASNLTSELVLQLAVYKGARQPVSFTDDTGDGAPNYADLKDVTVSDDGTDLIILFHTAAVQPSSSTYTVFCYNFYIADTRYETYSLDGYYVYDYDKQGDVDGASMRLSSTGFEVRLPLSELDLEFPMTFYMTSRIGECAIRGGAQELDRAPNEGTVTYG